MIIARFFFLKIDVLLLPLYVRFYFWELIHLKTFQVHHCWHNGTYFCIVQKTLYYRLLWYHQPGPLCVTVTYLILTCRNVFRQRHRLLLSRRDWSFLCVSWREYILYMLSRETDDLPFALFNLWLCYRIIHVKTLAKSIFLRSVKMKDTELPALFNV